MIMNPKLQKIILDAHICTGIPIHVLTNIVNDVVKFHINDIREVLNPCTRSKTTKSRRKKRPT